MCITKKQTSGEKELPLHGASNYVFEMLLDGTIPVKQGSVLRNLKINSFSRPNIRLYSSFLGNCQF